jgi:hypothetical protein
LCSPWRRSPPCARGGAQRGSERSTGIAERALLIGMRPVLVPSRRTDPLETVRFVDGRSVSVADGKAAIERDGENYYFVIPLRNVGTGLAVLQSWHTAVLQPRPDTGHPKPEEFRRQTLDLYVRCWRHGLLAGSGARARRPVPRRPPRSRHKRDVAPATAPDERTLAFVAVAHASLRRRALPNNGNHKSAATRATRLLPRATSAPGLVAERPSSRRAQARA